MPSPELVQRALDQIRKRPANYEYFFAKLASSDWIDPLKQAGLFSEPPPAHREGDAISFPFWPESQYLARMASLAPEKVLAVIENIPETGNVRIHDDFARAAAAMPGPLAARWAQREIAWMDRQEYLYFLLPDGLGELSEHLAETGEIETALQLLRSLLRVVANANLPSGVGGLFDAWEYGEILKKYFPVLLQAAGLDALDLLCDLLEMVFKDSSEADLSWIWRPAIESHAQNIHSGEIRDILVDAIRDSAAALAQDGASECTSVLDVLARHSMAVFRRIELHLLAEYFELVPERATTVATSRNNFEDRRVHHEYTRLLRTAFPHLSDALQGELFEWIVERSEVEEDEFSPEIREKRKAYRQASWLAILKDVLPERWKLRYAELIHQVGEPEHPEFLSYTTTWWGPVSPKDREELEEMSASDIAGFLRSWQPSEGWDNAEPEGLARTLEAVVAKSPHRFVESIAEFRGVDPTYARAIVGGFREVVRRGESFDWQEVLDFLAWIVSMPRSIDGRRSEHLDQDPHWGWARKATASLLSAGLEKDAIGLRLRRKAWDVLLPLTDDPDPTPEEDAKSSMDPATYSLNTTRGEAMHAVVRYGLWLYRVLGERAADTVQQAGSFDAIPEVRGVLERHLDPGSDPSPAIRAVYGQWFPWLFLLDRTWAMKYRSAIFSREVSPDLGETAWTAYITVCPVFNEVFEVLRREYSAAVDRLSGEHLEGGWTGNPQEKLGQHLMVLVGRGLITFDTYLCSRFFRNASDKVAAHSLAFVGRSLRNEEEKGVVERLCGLWESVLASMKEARVEHRETLKAFGWWFANGAFEPLWSFRNLLEVVNLAGGVAADFNVVKRLAELAEEYPATALTALKALVRGDKNGWSILGWRENAVVVLKIALRNPSTLEDAERFIHELGAKGHLQFRDLLAEADRSS